MSTHGTGNGDGRPARPRMPTGPTSPRRTNKRASIAVTLSVCGVLAVPGAVLFARQSKLIPILKAEWAIPFAFAFAIAALVLARGAAGEISRTLERAGGRGRIRASRRLAVAGISIALSATIAVGFYHLLLRLEG